MGLYRTKQIRFVIILLCVGLLLSLLASGWLAYRSYQAEKQFVALQQEINRLTNNANALENENKSLETENRNLNKQLSELEGEITALEKQVKEQAKELSKPVVSPSSTSHAKKLIALTFDDGPSATQTPRLLEAMKQRGVHATFFITGINAGKNKPLLSRMAKEGHCIGNHTYSHAKLTELSAEEIKQQFTLCSEAIASVTGSPPLLARAPGGNIDDTVLSCLTELDMTAIGWSVDTRDWESRDVTAILNTAFQSGKYGICDGAIVLMHDVYETSVEAAVVLIDRLLEEGYTLVTVPELLAARHSSVSAGVLYKNGFQ